MISQLELLKQYDTLPEPLEWVIVPAIPPSVNLYFRQSVGKYGKMAGKVMRYKSKEAKAFDTEMQWACRGKMQLRLKSSQAYELSMVIFLGDGERGDVDNFPKMLIDGLVDNKVLDSDAKVANLHVYKRRDRKNPRVSIAIWIIPKPKDED